MFNIRASDILINLPVLLLSFTLHEIAHGYTAYRLGDLTAKNDGRLSLNPIKHIDPIGLIVILTLHFGWAKPVMINPNNLKDPKKDMAVISLAGPMTNLLLSILFFIPFYTFLVRDPALISTLSSPKSIQEYLFLFLYLGVLMNISLAMFNILPFPPLDGSKVFGSLLPDRIYCKSVLFDPRIGMGVLLLLSFTGILSKIINPMIDSVLNLYVLAANHILILLK